MPVTGTGLLIVALMAGGYFVGKPIVHVARKTGHVVCHAVTLGHECNAVKPAASPTAK